MVAVTVSLKGKAPLKLDFAGKAANDVSIKEVKTAVQAKVPKVCSGLAALAAIRPYPCVVGPVADLLQLVRNRQRLTLPVDGKKPTPLVDEAKTLADYGVTDGTTLRLKDLGKQVPYRVLYLWEYVSRKRTNVFPDRRYADPVTGRPHLPKPLVPALLPSDMGQVPALGPPAVSHRSRSCAVADGILVLMRAQWDSEHGGPALHQAVPGIRVPA